MSSCSGGQAARTAARVEEAASFIRRGWRRTARAGLILGTGLGHLARRIETDLVIAYEDLPHFPRSTAPGHTGQLVCGRLERCPVVAMEGRCHVYEGYGIDRVGFPVRVMRALGADLLIVSNASGGLNPKLAAGDVIVVCDHINLMRRRSAAGGLHVADGRLAGRAKSPYDPSLIELALTISRREGFAAHQGVYVAVTGPNYETRAEYRFLRCIGGDAVGMSTVPELIAAAACGMRALALSVVSNVASPDAPRRVESDQVIAAASAAASNLDKIVCGVLARQDRQRD